MSRPPFNNNSDNEIETILKSKDKISIWADGNKQTIRKELLDSEALATATNLKDLPSTQLRKFYVPIVALKSRLNLDLGNKITDLDIVALVAGMKANSAYAAGRVKPKSNTPKEEDVKKYEAARYLVSFFTKAANTIQDRADYLAFARHFEAIVAYHKIFDKNK